eukprot:5158382-Prorocentrum_lima.AAC.1
MTSSLVGSEMCIRDRCFRLDATRERALALHVECAFGRGPDWSTTSTTAVSYTHLTLPTICSV